MEVPGPSCSTAATFATAGSFNLLHQAGDQTCSPSPLVGFLTHCTTVGTPSALIILFIYFTLFFSTHFKYSEIKGDSFPCLRVIVKIQQHEAMNEPGSVTSTEKWCDNHCLLSPCRAFFTITPDLPPSEFVKPSTFLLPQDTLCPPHFVGNCYWSMKAPPVCFLYLYFPHLFSYSTSTSPMRGKHSKCLICVLCLYVSLQSVPCCFVYLFLNLHRCNWIISLFLFFFPTQHFVFRCPHVAVCTPRPWLSLLTPQGHIPPLSQWQPPRSLAAPCLHRQWVSWCMSPMSPSGHFFKTNARELNCSVGRCVNPEQFWRKICQVALGNAWNHLHSSWPEEPQVPTSLPANNWCFPALSFYCQSKNIK